MVLKLALLEKHCKKNSLMSKGDDENRRPFARVKEVHPVGSKAVKLIKKHGGSGSESFSNNLYYQTPRLNASGQRNFG